MNQIKQEDPLQIELNYHPDENVQDPIKIEVEDFKHDAIKIETHDQPESTTVDPKLSQSNQAKFAVRKSNQKCDICTKEFSSTRNLKLHESANHCNKPIDKFYKCRYCDKTFNSLQALNQHKNEHEPVCNICDGKFPTISELSKHTLKQHNGSQKMQCDICGKQFQSKKYVQKHLSTVHIGKRLHCDMCEKNFAGKQTLTEHKNQLHSKEKNVFYEKCLNNLFTSKIQCKNSFRLLFIILLCRFLSQRKRKMPETENITR